MSTSTTFKFTFVLSTLLVSSIASSALIVTSSSSTFATAVALQGGSVLTESFDGYNGFYASGLTGGSGDLAWTATALGGLYADATSSALSTNNAEVALTMTFSSPNVFAVGGYFYKTDQSFNTAPGRVVVTVGAVSYFYESNGGSTAFAGFISTSGAINSITFQPFDLGAQVYATASSVVVGVVPSPAVLALGALAGAFGRRRRN
jgi:MYXO-CTERM domain-containing protein